MASLSKQKRLGINSGYFTHSNRFLYFTVILSLSSFLRFKASFRLRQLFRKMLAVKLQKCFVDYETTSFRNFL